MNLTVKFDTTQIEKALGELKSELPYATSVAINNTLVDVQTANINHMRDVFTIRREAFLKRSVKITRFAKKTDLTGTIEIADVGGKRTADIFTKFERGGTKTATQGRNVAIPSSQVKPSKSGIIPKSRRPANLPRSFKIEEGNTSYIFQRTRKEVRLMYTLKPSVRIPDRMNFVDVGVQTINRVANTNMEKGIERALKSSKFQ